MSEWRTVDAAPPRAAGTGPRVSLGMNAGGTSAELWINAAAAEEYFGGTINLGDRMEIALRWQSGRPQLRLRRADGPGAIAAVTGMRQSVKFRLERFAACPPRERVKSQPCAVIDIEEETGAVIVALPSFCNMPPVRGEADA